MTGVGSIGLCVHHSRPMAEVLAHRIIAWADREGHAVRLLEGDALGVGRPDLAVEAAALPAGLDLMVSLGGDGTMLRALDLVSRYETPLLGVNVGQLGYLTAVEPAGTEQALERFFAGEHVVDERMMVAVRVDAPSWGEGASPEELGLNEVVLEKAPMGHTVRLAVHLEGKFFTTYAADGLIVATPTGSTAYAFSARGPIVAPAHRALALTPVSPHMLFDRTLVLEPTTEVRLEVVGERPATLSVDGRTLGTLVGGDALVCTAAPERARLVAFGHRDFHQILKRKFGLNDR